MTFLREFEYMELESAIAAYSISPSVMREAIERGGIQVIRVYGARTALCVRTADVVALSESMGGTGR